MGPPFTIKCLYLNINSIEEEKHVLDWKKDRRYSCQNQERKKSIANRPSCSMSIMKICMLQTDWYWPIWQFKWHRKNHRAKLSGKEIDHDRTVVSEHLLIPGNYPLVDKLSFQNIPRWALSVTCLLQTPMLMMPWSQLETLFLEMVGPGWRKVTWGMSVKRAS